MKDENTKEDELPKVSKQNSSKDRPLSDEESGKVSGGAINRNPDPEEDLLIP